MQKSIVSETAMNGQKIEVSPAELQLFKFISSVPSDDLYEVIMSALFYLSDSDLAEGKRWILVRLTDQLHKISLEKWNAMTEVTVQKKGDGIFVYADNIQNWRLAR